ncbi:ATP-binding protein [Shewanella sp. PP-Sp27a-2]
MKLIESIAIFQKMGPIEQMKELNLLTELMAKATAKELESAIKSATSPYLKSILNGYLQKKNNIITASKPATAIPYNVEIDIEAIKSEAYAESVGQVLHELEPLIGSISLHASEEIINFENSETSKDLKFLEQTMQTFEDWIKVEQNPRFSYVSVSDIINNEIVALSAIHNILITNNLPTNLYFDTDKSMLRIIISNVLRNSIQATNPNKFDSLPILINAGITDRELWISVLDNGEGLNEHQSTLLKSKYTTKVGNRGLGLTILNKAVTALNGKWDLKNGVSRGAEFYLELPNRAQ